MLGHRFSKFLPDDKSQDPFERLFGIFMQLLNYTSGDVHEAMNWLNELDREHKLTDDKYTMADFINDLKSKGYIKEDANDGNLSITPKTEQTIRKNALEEVFGKMKKAGQDSDFNSTDDRYFSFDDLVWRRQNYACKKSCNGSC